MKLKAISVAAAMKEIEVATWNWSDIVVVFVHIIREKTATENEEMTSEALRDNEKEVERVIYKAEEFLKKLHKVEAGNRLKEIVKMTEQKLKK